MAGNLAPHFDSQFFDSNGDPLNGGLVYSYQAGTSTPQATYTDSTLGVANANPVVLDSAGRAAIWLDPSLSYKFVLQTSGGSTIKTVDNVIGTLTADAVNTDALQDGVLSADANGRAKMADDFVTADKLRDDAATDGNRAVTTNHIRDSAITTAKINDSAVTGAKLSTGMVVQSVITSSAAVSTGTTTIPSDNTIPQNTEGTEFITRAITPTNASNRLLIHAVLNYSHGTDGALTIAALFQDTTANALHAMSVDHNAGTRMYQVHLFHEMAAGTTSATTFKVRIGPATAGTVTFNGASGAGYLGGVIISSLRVTEIKG
jgi:hypothetical protein